MRNLWLIAKHEYLKIVRQKSFLFGTLGIPVLIIVVMAVSILAAIGQENGRLTLRVARAQAAAITARLLNDLPVVDLTVEDPPIESVIDQVYQEGVV